jgi:hypothetical protein
MSMVKEQALAAFSPVFPSAPFLQVIRYTTVWDKQRITQPITCICEIRFPPRNMKIGTPSIFEYTTIGCASFPAWQNVEKPHIHGTHSQNILGDLALPISIRRMKEFRCERCDMCAIKCAETILEKWIKGLGRPNFMGKWFIFSR